MMINLIPKIGTVLLLLIFFTSANAQEQAIGPELSETRKHKNYSDADVKNIFRGQDSDDSEVIRIGVVDRLGYASGQYFNEVFEANEESRFYKEYGIKVDFKIIDDPKSSLEAWKRGDIDLHWYTLDAFPTIYEGIKEYNPIVVFQTAWSRGEDVIVVRSGINNVKDLKGRKIAVTEQTSSHTFLLWLLESSGLSQNDIEIVPTSSASQAADFFKSQRVDAAITLRPLHKECLYVVKGASGLETTRSSPYLIADIFFAKRDYVKRNRDKLQKLYDGWMIGASEIENDEESMARASQILTKGFGHSRSKISLHSMRYTTHGDNLNFFGFDAHYKGITAYELYKRMTDIYTELGYIEDDIPSWRHISYPNFIQRSTLRGEQHRADFLKTLPSELNSQKVKEAIFTRRVSIHFRPGQYQLDENAKYIIDREFIGNAKKFNNARILVVGATDASEDVELSENRAQSVMDYMISQHGLDSSRFLIIGNGNIRPVADNASPAGRAQNRRTDFELLRD